MDDGDSPVRLVDDEDGQAVGRADDEEQPRFIRHQGVALELCRRSLVQAMDDIGMELAHDDRLHAPGRGESQEIRFAPAGPAEAMDEAADPGEARHGEKAAFRPGHEASITRKLPGAQGVPMYLDSFTAPDV